jgi:hypothetical protein
MTFKTEELGELAGVSAEADDSKEIRNRDRLKPFRGRGNAEYDVGQSSNYCLKSASGNGEHSSTV